MKKLSIFCSSLLITLFMSGQSNLTKQMNELLDYAKDGFKAIKGEEVKVRESSSLINQNSNKKVYWRFKTNFLPEDAQISEIRYYPEDKSTKFIASYYYTFSAELRFSGVFEDMKKELKNDFIYEADEKSINKDRYDKSQRAIFYRKDTKHPRIELIYNNKTDTTENGMPEGVLMVITSTKNQSTVAENKSSVNQNKLASQLLELLDHSKNGFKTIKGNINKELTEKYKIIGHTYYKTSFDLEGAIERYIEESGSSYRPVSFKAYFGKDLSVTGGDDLFKKLAEEIKQGFTDGFVIKKDFKNDEGDLYETITVQRRNDDLHYIELTLVNADDINSDRIEVYIVIK